MSKDTEREKSMIRIQVWNEICGDAIFWEGYPDDIDTLRKKNVVSHRVYQALLNLAIAIKLDDDVRYLE